MSHSTTALIVAAGKGERFGAPKQYQPLLGKAVLLHTIEIFLEHPKIDQVQVVIDPAHGSLYQQTVQQHIPSLPPPVFGGTTRQESVSKGLGALHNPAFVLIHDAARALLEPVIIDHILEALEQAHPSVLTAIPMTDTLHDQKGESKDRTNLYALQTPQAFAFKMIQEAHQSLSGTSFTDDGSLAKTYGITPHYIKGNPCNIKITHPEDLLQAEKILLSRHTDIRVGNGVDVHGFTEGDHVTLCGINVPHTHALAGHSDADVALHAITDALLGAIGEGDIGLLFPSSDPKWKNADSRLFVAKAQTLLQKKNALLSHLDVTLICETPKITPYREEMRQAISEMLCLSQDRISVKATTTDRLGFTGRKEGIAALATATIRL